MVAVPPFRGDQVASGVVVATALVVLLELRMGWPAGGRLALAAAAAGGAGLLVAGCPREPRPYVSAIVTSALVLLALALARLGEVLGAGGPVGGAGAAAWKLAVLGLTAALLARAYDAAASTLVAGLALAFVPVLAVRWAGDPSAGLQRALLLATAIGLALAAVSRRDRSPAHAAQLANAGGVALAALAVVPALARGSVLAVGAGTGVSVVGPGAGIGWAWEVPMVLGGFGLLAYGAVDRQRGPVLAGLLVLGAWIGSAAADGHGSLLGWPAVLAVAAAFMLVVGLRPTTPAPPDPLGGDREDPEPLPLR